MLAGCGSNSGANNSTEPAKSDDGKSGNTAAAVKMPEVPTTPVTLKFYAHVDAMTEDYFKDSIQAPVQKKYPYITMTFGKGTRGDLEKLVATGEIPDIVFTGNENFLSASRLGLPMDMTDMIKRFNVDLNQFLPEAVTAIKVSGGGKTFPAIPFGTNAGATFYNKDVFDKFGVAYPTNGMTWDNVLEISHKLTRSEDGTQYIGWDVGFPDAIAAPFGVPLVDPKTNKANIDNDVYKKVFGMMSQAWQEPGHLGEKNNTNRYAPAVFIGDKRIGMYTDWLNKMLQPLIEADTKGAAPNWDIVTIPNFPENKGKGRDLSVQYLFISQQSKYKDQAMQAILALTSVETQTALSRDGRMPVLKDPAISKQFGADVPALKGKHMENLFLLPPSADLSHSLYDNEVRAIIRKVSERVGVKKDDINTALREAQAEADKTIAEMSQ
jgi:multiple sugar transport system substrate-binding protein